MNNNRKSLLPKQFLWRLSFINLVVVASFIVISGWAIYNTACFLVDGMVLMNDQKQNKFNSTLFHYLWIFSITAIVAGSVIHFYILRKLIRPLRELIESTKRMKEGYYPNPIEVKYEDEIGKLIGHFNELVQQLKDTHHHRQKLVSDLSHEFRTPLSNINGYLHALKNGMIEGNPKLYQSLYEESKRLTSMLEQLEQLKEWDYVSKQSFSEKESFDMALPIENAVQMFSWSFKRANISVEVQADHGTVQAVYGGVQQVISNLIDNAIRYYNGTGPIVIAGENLGTEYKVSVIGPGLMIPLVEQGRIFARFYRIDPSRNRETGGSGLGLAISKEIVEHHNGKIGLCSTGDYHTFWFSLPRC